MGESRVLWQVKQKAKRARAKPKENQNCTLGPNSDQPTKLPPKEHQTKHANQRDQTDRRTDQQARRETIASEALQVPGGP